MPYKIMTEITREPVNIVKTEAEAEQICSDNNIKLTEFEVKWIYEKI